MSEIGGEKKEEQIWIGNTSLNDGTSQTLFTYIVVFTKHKQLRCGKRAEEK